VGSCQSIIKKNKSNNLTIIELIHDWYNNEWGYSCRLAEFAEFVGKRI